VCAVCVLPSPYTDTLPPTHTAHQRTLPVRSLAPLAHASHPRADGKAGKNNDGRVECNVARVLRTRKRESIALTANHILVTMKLSTTFSAFAATVLAVSSRGVQAQNPANISSDLASMNPHEIRVPANPSLAFGLIEHYSTISYDNDQFELYDRPSKELVATGQVISRGGDNESAVVASFEGACLALTTDSPPQVALNSWCKCKSVFSMYEGNNKSNVVCHYKLGMGPGSEGTVTGVYIVQRPGEARMVKGEGASKNLRGV
jgi:hypothetical protein